jgi:hypothetical protein
MLDTLDQGLERVQQFGRGGDQAGVCPHFAHIMDMRPAGILGLVLNLCDDRVTLPDVGVGEFPSLPIVTSDCHCWRVYIPTMDAPWAARVCVFCCHVVVMFSFVFSLFSAGLTRRRLAAFRLVKWPLQGRDCKDGEHLPPLQYRQGG